jgi:proteasome lid subunit RPN8/RPN11
MSDSYLSDVARVIIDPRVVQATLRTMRQFGARGFEALVLWLGSVKLTQAYVTNAFVPNQQPVTSESGVGYFVSGETLFQLNRSLADTGLRLIAQVHSHPGEAYHSKADDRYAIVTADGGFSLVVPDFGRAPANPSSWAVYRLIRGDWRELDSLEAETMLHMSNGR